MNRSLVTSLAIILLGGLLFTTALNAQELNLKQYRGQIIWVDFWASWCKPCRKSFPWLNRMEEKYGDLGLKIIGVNLDEKSADAKAFLKQVPAKFTIIYNPGGELGEKYQVEAMPTTLLFDGKGKLISRHEGFYSTKTTEYEAKIRAALATLEH